MKAYKIKTYIKTESGYLVSLGNSTKTEFKTLIKTKAFLAETNRFLTDTFFKVNLIYLNAYCIWRNIITVSQRAQFDRQCKEYLEMAENCLYSSYKKSEWDTGNQFTFIDLSKSISFLQGALDLMLPFVIKRSDTHSRYFIESLQKDIRVQVLALFNYAKVEVRDLKESDVHAELFSKITNYEQHKMK